MYILYDKTGVLSRQFGKQDAFFEYGLKAVAQPLSESAIRQMLESNQRVINDVAERSLKPTMYDYFG